MTGLGRNTKWLISFEGILIWGKAVGTLLAPLLVFSHLLLYDSICINFFNGFIIGARVILRYHWSIVSSDCDGTNAGGKK